MQWLMCQGVQQKQTLIALAQSRRKMVGEEMEQEAKALMEKKIDERARLIERAQVKKRRLHDDIEDLKTEPIIRIIC